jgi:hypothetical protein
MYKPSTADSEDHQISGENIIDVTSSDVAGYISDMCGELAVMAKQANMPLLWYLLKLASAEADTNCRDAGAISH